MTASLSFSLIAADLFTNDHYDNSGLYFILYYYTSVLTIKLLLKCYDCEFELIHSLLTEELIDLFFVFHINLNLLFFAFLYLSGASITFDFFILKLLNN